jgi:hypothetical protein
MMMKQPLPLLAAGLPLPVPVRLPCCGATPGDPPELPLRAGAGLNDGLGLGDAVATGGGGAAVAGGAGTDET